MELNKNNLEEMRESLFQSVLGGKKYNDFFKWWDNKFSSKDYMIPWHVVTVENWRLFPERTMLPYMSLFCRGYELDQEIVSKNNFEWFGDWRRKNKLHTFQSVADVFGISKQAVNNWYRRGQLPVWLRQACYAFDDYIENH